MAALQPLLQWLAGTDWKTPTAVISGILAFVYLFEQWRGQRLSNAKLKLEMEKLKLELKATSEALRKEELERVAEAITGKRLPESNDAPAAFRAMLQEWAKDKALAELHKELDELRDRLAASEEALADFSCPYCHAPLSERQGIPLGGERDDWGTAETYVCGYTTSDLGTTCPCPSDPEFPRLEEFELKASERPGGDWSCWPEPKTPNARRLQLSGGHGRTEAEAIQRVREAYERYTGKWTPR